MNITTHETLHDRDLTVPANEDSGQTETSLADASQLFPRDAADEFRVRWDRIQTGFVDAPRKAVEEADQLVADAVQRLSARFTDARNQLEQQWDRGDQVNTEDLRLALQSYRTFFRRILSA